MTKEIKSLTSIRGIAAVYVMIFHFYYLPIDFNISISYFIRHIINHGHLAVDLFFFLSAFVMCLAYQNKFNTSVDFSSYKTFMIKRFARIYPLYFVFCFVYFFIYQKPLYTLPLNLTLFQIFFDQHHYLVDVFWSLSTEWIMYFIFPFLFLLMNRWRNVYLNLFLLITLPLCLYLLKFVDYRVVTSSGITNLEFTTNGMARGFVAIIRCFIGYIIGISLFNLLTNIDLDKYKKHFNPLYLLIFVPFFFIKEPNYFFLVFYIFLIAVCYINDARMKFIKTEFFYKLGIWSYSIYICHRAVKFGLNYIIESHHLLNLSAVIISIAISYITYTYIEHYFNKKLVKALV